MFYRNASQASPASPSSRTYVDNVAAFGRAAASPGSRFDNPMLCTMAVAGAQLSELQASADAWVATAQARMAVARDASEFGAAVEAMAGRASGGAAPERLPQALREFAVRHELVSAQAADAPFDAAGLQALGARLQSLAMNGSASSTSDQIRLKRFVTRYDNTLTLYNAVISRLGEMMKRLVSSL